jgi:phosphatidylinositol alpha-mannosyltransferase
VGLSANGSVAPVTLDPRAAVEVEQAVRRQGLEVVHLHEPMAPVLGYACLARHPAPLVGTYHRSGSSRWYSALGPMARWADRRLDARCAVSEAAAATARHALGGTIEVLFNGIELERYAGAEPWPADGPTIFFLGRHEPRKGLATLLEAVTSDRRLAEVTVWVGSSGPQTDDLRGRFSESGRIQWLGVLDDEEAARRFRGASVFCAPSLYGESFGVVLLEALAAGTVVVASDIPGYREAAAGQAELAPPGDPGALAEALSRALSDVAGQVGRASPEARAAAAAHAGRWSMAELARRYLVVYEAAMASSNLARR